MNLDMFHDVILTRDLPEHGLCSGDVGTVVERHEVPGKEVGYSVEFFDMTGRIVAVVIVPASALRAPTAADRPSASGWAIELLPPAGTRWDPSFRNESQRSVSVR
jgi:hypothetical protein